MQRILLPTTGGNAYITNTYDSRARLLSTQVRNELHAVLNSHAYQLDGMMRTRMTRTDGSYEDYGYDKHAVYHGLVVGDVGGVDGESIRTRATRGPRAWGVGVGTVAVGPSCADATCCVREPEITSGAGLWGGA